MGLKSICFLALFFFFTHSCLSLTIATNLLLMSSEKLFWPTRLDLGTGFVTCLGLCIKIYSVASPFMSALIWFSFKSLLFLNYLKSKFHLVWGEMKVVSLP